jgi:hypothetical protein
VFKVDCSGSRAMPLPLHCICVGASTRTTVASKWPLRVVAQGEAAPVPWIKGSTVAPPCTLLPYLIVEKIVIKDEYVR